MGSKSTDKISKTSTPVEIESSGPERGNDLKKIRSRGRPNENTVSKGAIKRAIRKIDLAFGPCIKDYDCETIPPEFFEESLILEDMEDVWIGTGPYPGMGNISLLPPGNHEIKFHMSPK